MPAVTSESKKKGGALAVASQHRTGHVLKPLNGITEQVEQDPGRGARGVKVRAAMGHTVLRGLIEASRLKSGSPSN